jgi:hypothetical protein
LINTIHEAVRRIKTAALLPSDVPEIVDEIAGKYDASDPIRTILKDKLTPLLVDICSKQEIQDSQEQCRPCDKYSSTVDQSHLTGLRHLLRSNVMTVLNDTIRDVTAAGCTDDRVAEFIAKHGSHLFVPDEILREVEKFVVSYYAKTRQPNKETQTFLRESRTLACPSHCFVVFHDGQNHYCHDTLPEEVLTLRETAMFWLNWIAKDFCSGGRRRAQPQPQPEHLLRFISAKQNAGEKVPIETIYQKVWQRDPASSRKMIESVQVAMSKLNAFEFQQFEDRSNPDAMARRVGDNYIISKDMPSKCCIIGHRPHKSRRTGP